jgi:glutamyl-tRNA synthetase
VLVNEQRKKLSKRRDKVALEQYRAEGILADAMVNYLMTLGWAPAGDTEIVPWSRVVGEFRLEDVNHSPAFFDVKKLTAFNGDYVRMLTPGEFLAAARPFLGPGAPWPAGNFDEALFERAAPMVQTRVGTLSEIPAMVDFLFLDSAPVDDDAWNKTMSSDYAADVLAHMETALGSVEWDHEQIKRELEEFTEARGLKLGKTQAPLRVAVTGRTVGPPLFESIEILGRDATLARVRTARARLG